MSFIVNEVGKVLTIKLKSRSDTLSDQFNRIFMVKILLVCSICTGVNWYKDSLHCISGKGISSGFAASACWIQGVYIYEELKYRIDDVGYYGIPKDVSNDGMLFNGELCSTTPRSNEFVQRKRISKSCQPLTKTFHLEYQWLPFYIAALAVLYYLPYIMHMHCNQDMISLKRSVKNGDTDPERVVNAYFKRKSNPLYLHWLRIFNNYLIKLAYIIVNLAAFIGTDKLMLGKFKNYGTKWAKWNRLENQIAHDYMGGRDHPKPGNELLPPFGYCEIYEAAKDIKESYSNHHKFVCEVSQNVLSQYALLILWFFIVIATVVSLLGLITVVLNHVITLVYISHRHRNMARRIYGKLSLRECEYLEFIRQKDIPLYGEVLEKLKEEAVQIRLDSEHSGSLEMDSEHSLPCETPPPGFEEATKDSRL